MNATWPNWKSWWGTEGWSSKISRHCPFLASGTLHNSPTVVGSCHKATPITAKQVRCTQWVNGDWHQEIKAISLLYSDERGPFCSIEMQRKKAHLETETGFRQAKGRQPSSTISWSWGQALWPKGKKGCCPQDFLWRGMSQMRVGISL